MMQPPDPDPLPGAGGCRGAQGTALRRQSPRRGAGGGDGPKLGEGDEVGGKGLMVPAEWEWTGASPSCGTSLPQQR